MKLRRMVRYERDGEGNVVPGTERHLGFMIKCPGCGDHHAIYTTEKNQVGAIWTFDGNEESPTFSPSVRVSWASGAMICHFFIKKGQIEFCSDSTHVLAGRTVPMEAIE